jgi:hypothetical protein
MHNVRVRRFIVDLAAKIRKGDDAAHGKRSWPSHRALASDPTRSLACLLARPARLEQLAATFRDLAASLFQGARARRLRRPAAHDGDGCAAGPQRALLVSDSVERLQTEATRWLGQCPTGPSVARAAAT